MATHHVADLDLRVVGEDDAWVGEQAERWVRSLWAAVGERLEHDCPGRVFRVRAWEGRWRVARHELTGPPPTTLVHEVAAHCRRAALLDVADPPGRGAEAVSWADEATRVAAWCAAVTSGADRHWAWADLDASGSVALVLRGLGPNAAWGVLDRLDHAELVEPVLARLAEHELLLLRELLVPAGAAEASGRPPAGEGAGQAPRATEGAGGVRAALVAAVRRRRGAAVPPPPPRSVVPRVGDVAEGVRRGVDGHHETAPPAGTGDGAVFPVPAVPEPARAAVLNGSAAAGPSGPVVPTDWGGLVYLVGPILECGVGEVLWEACLPEAVVLRDALGALCGPDPAAAALSGSAEGDLPPVDPEQVDEVRRALFARWRTAAGRRGGHVPALSVGAGPGGLVVLHGAESAWPCAAWDADDRSAREAAASLAGGLVSSDVEPWAAPGNALATMAVGAPALLLAARTGDFGPDRLRQPARIEDDGDTLWFHLPGDAVDLALRRAGADADPGWAPWLLRHVRITYDVGAGG